jgi:hypothetical protein
MAMTGLTAVPSWQALMTHHAQIGDLHLRDLGDRSFGVLCNCR